MYNTYLYIVWVHNYVYLKGLAAWESLISDLEFENISALTSGQKQAKCQLWSLVAGISGRQTEKRQNIKTHQFSLNMSVVLLLTV